MPRIPRIHAGPPPQISGLPPEPSPYTGLLDTIDQVSNTLALRAEKEREEARNTNLSRALTMHTGALAKLKIDGTKITDPDQREKFYSDGLVKVRRDAVGLLDPDQVIDFDFRTANTRASHEIHFADAVTGLRVEAINTQAQAIEKTGLEALDVAGGDELLARDVEADVRGQYEALGLPTAIVDSKMADFQRGADLHALNRMIEEDTRGAIALLRDPQRFYEMTDQLNASDRESLLKIAEKKRAGDLAEAQKGAEWELRKGLRAAQNSGDVDQINAFYAQIDAAVNRGLVSPATGASMMSGLDSQREKLIEDTANEGVFELLYDRAARTGVPIDPNSMEKFDEAVDRHYEEMMVRAGADPEAQFAATVEFVGVSGVVPSALKSRIDVLSRSSDPELAATAAQTYDRLAKALPQHADRLASKEVSGMLHDIAASTMLAGGGDNAATAVQAARERRVTDPIVREAREQSFKAFVKDGGGMTQVVMDRLGDLGRVEDGGFLWFDAVAEPENVPSEFIAAVGRSAQNYLYTSDDPEWAIRQAVQDAAKGWGPDQGFDGVVRLKPLPPSKFHLGYNREEAAVEVTAEVNAQRQALNLPPVDHKQVHLWPTMEASRRARGGVHSPNYYVMVQEEGGPEGGVPFIQADGSPLTYEPGPAPVVEGQGGFTNEATERIVTQYLRGEIDEIDGLDPKLVERLHRIRDARKGPNGDLLAAFEEGTKSGSSAMNAVRVLLREISSESVALPTLAEMDP